MKSYKFNKQKKIIGFMLDENELDFFSFHLIDWAIKSKKFSKIYLFTLSGNYKKKIYKPFFKRSFKKLLSNTIFKLINNFEKLFIPKKFEKYFNKYNLKLFNNVIEVKIHPKIKNNLYTYYFSKKDLNTIKKTKVNLLVRLCSGILRGDILKIAKNGVISVHHGDPDQFRGGPPGFWEVHNKIPNSYFIIQKLEDELDNGKIYLKGSIQTKHFYLLNQIFIKEKSLYFFKKYILKVLDSNIEILETNLPYFRQFYTFPGIKISFNYILSTYGNIVLRKIFKNKQKYSIYFQKKNWTKLSLKNCKQIKDKVHSYADPFLLQYNSKQYIFYEKFNINNVGKIGVFDIYKNQDLGLINFKNENSHKSFPFVFKYKNKIYMVPETHKLNEIRLYECEKFPMKWKLSKILIKNIKAVDTIILFKKNMFWLFTNICSSNLEDFSSEMHIFYSKNVLSNNWKPHKKNPVIFNGLFGRNAGLIKDKSYYRVSQTHNFLDYGSKININKIIKLSTTDYQEEDYVVNKKSSETKFSRVHHLNFKDNFSVFDYKSN